MSYRPLVNSNGSTTKLDGSSIAPVGNGVPFETITGLPEDGAVYQFDASLGGFRLFNNVTADFTRLQLADALPTFTYASTGVKNFHTGGRKIRVRSTMAIPSGRWVCWAAGGSTADPQIQLAQPPGTQERFRNTQVVGVLLNDVEVGGAVDVAVSGLVGIQLGLYVTVAPGTAPVENFTNGGGCFAQAGSKYDDGTQSGFANAAGDGSSVAQPNNPVLGSVAYPQTQVVNDFAALAADGICPGVILWLQASTEGT